MDDHVPLSLRYAPALQNASSRCKVLRSVLCLSRSAKHDHEAYACLCETTKDYMYIVHKRIDISQPVRRRQQLPSCLRPRCIHAASRYCLKTDAFSVQQSITRRSACQSVHVFNFHFPTRYLPRKDNGQHEKMMRLSLFETFVLLFPPKECSQT